MTTNVKETDTVTSAPNPTEVSLFLPPDPEPEVTSGAEDDNVNDISKIFLPPEESSQNPYETYKLVETVPPEEKDGTGNGNTVAILQKTRFNCEKCQNYKGILLTLLSSFIFTAGGVIVKYLKNFHPVSLAVYRFQGVLLPAIALAFYNQSIKKQEVISTVWPLTDKQKLKRFIFTSVRGILGGVALILLFTSIQTLSFADAIVINSSRPVFVTFVAHVFLGEPCGIFSVFAALLSVVGVGVIARPPILTGAENFDKETLIGVAISFTGMLTAAVSMVVLRYLRDVHVSLVALGFGFWGTLISVVVSLVIGRFDLPQTPEEYILAVCLAMATFSAQLLITMAMKYEQAGAVAIVRSCDSIFAFFLQFVVLGFVPDLFSMLGAILIISCVSMVAFRKWVSTLPEKHSVRQRFWFVLK